MKRFVKEIKYLSSTVITLDITPYDTNADLSVKNYIFDNAMLWRLTTYTEVFENNLFTPLK